MLKSARLHTTNTSLPTIGNWCKNLDIQIGYFMIISTIPVNANASSGCKVQKLKPLPTAKTSYGIKAPAWANFEPESQIFHFLCAQGIADCLILMESVNSNFLGPLLDLDKTPIKMRNHEEVVQIDSDWVDDSRSRAYCRLQALRLPQSHIPLLSCLLCLSFTTDREHAGDCCSGNDTTAPNGHQLFRHVSGCGRLARRDVRHATQGRISSLE
jgi:hypothetical protein